MSDLVTSDSNVFYFGILTPVSIGITSLLL